MPIGRVILQPRVSVELGAVWGKRECMENHYLLWAMILGGLSAASLPLRFTLAPEQQDNRGTHRIRRWSINSCVSGRIGRPHSHAFDAR